MKIVFCTLTLSSYRSSEAAERGYPLADERKPVWDWLVRHGFDGIDLGETWFNFYDAPDEALVELGEEVRSHGLEIGGLTVLRKVITWPAPEEVRETNRALLRRAVQAAGLAGAPLVNMSISPQPWEVGIREQDLRGQADPVGSSMRARDEDYEEAAGVLKALAQEASPKGTALTLELHQNSIVDTPDGMLRLIELVDHPLIKAQTPTWAISISPTRRPRAAGRTCAGNWRPIPISGTSKIYSVSTSRKKTAPSTSTRPWARA